MGAHETHVVTPEPITAGKHHFFGYYDKFPWNASGRFHLGLQVDFIDRQPTGEDVAVIGTIDTENGNAWRPVAEITAWSWQQGTMAQWLPSEPESTITYNVRDGGQFFGQIHNLETGESHRLSHAVYAVCEHYALGLNYSRLHVTRPGYGYPDGAGDNTDRFHPEDDGVFRIDLATGESELIISLGRLHGINHLPEMDLGPMWVNHLTCSPEGTNFVFLNRWVRKHPRRPFSDRFYRASADGADLRIVHDNGYFSHFGYFSEEQLIGHARKPDGTDDYLMFDLYGEGYDIVGGDVFDQDGHCSFSPDRKWMLTDTYPDADNNRTLMLYEMATGRRVDIGVFHAPPALEGPLRCDLHPRWSRDGRKVSIDSAHDGERQIYVLDVSEITGGG